MAKTPVLNRGAGEQSAVLRAKLAEKRVRVCDVMCVCVCVCVRVCVYARVCVCAHCSNLGRIGGGPPKKHLHRVLLVRRPHRIVTPRTVTDGRGAIGAVPQQVQPLTAVAQPDVRGFLSSISNLVGSSTSTSPEEVCPSLHLATQRPFPPRRLAKWESTRLPIIQNLTNRGCHKAGCPERSR